MNKCQSKDSNFMKVKQDYVTKLEKMKKFMDKEEEIRRASNNNK
jgi:hypothetical protein